MHLFRRIPSYVRRKKETPPARGSALFLQPNYKIQIKHLQCGFDLESPRLKQRLRNVLRVLISTGPLTKSCGANVLVGRELELLHNLLERCYRWNNRPDRLRLAPIGISTTLCHIFISTSSKFDFRTSRYALWEINATFILRHLGSKSKGVFSPALTRRRLFSAVEPKRRTSPHPPSSPSRHPHSDRPCVPPDSNQTAHCSPVFPANPYDSGRTPLKRMG